MTATILLALVSLFSDRVSCNVQGYVYRMAEVDVIQWDRADVCPGVRVKVDQNVLHMESPTHWVDVIVPAEHGHRRFMYRWASNVAHIGADTVPVVWGVRSQ